jgi:hypothetical protein
VTGKMLIILEVNSEFGKIESLIRKTWRKIIVEITLTFLMASSE